MAALMIACPVTGQSFSTGIEVSAEQIGQLPNVLSAAHCPHCGTAHEWNVKDAWIVDESGNRLG
jgi:hypothetical protein